MKKVYNVNYGVRKIKTTIDRAKAGAALSVTGLVAAIALPFAVHAAPTTVVVTPTNTQGWSTSDTRPGGDVNYVLDPTAPGMPNAGALQLTTDSTTTAKAQYLHDTNTALSSVTKLSYATKQNSAGFVGGDASYQLATCLGGVVGTTCTGFTTFVYEPYENGTVTPGVWQSWDVAAGQMWSSRSYTDGANCIVTAGGGGAPFYTLADLQTRCPSAVAVGFGVNIGSNNPSYNVESDLVNFNGTTYNFEPYVAVSDKDACKNDGWKTQVDANGNGFKNQGACVSYVASAGKSQH
jgi:hypothetical protein